MKGSNIFRWMLVLIMLGSMVAGPYMFDSASAVDVTTISVSPSNQYVYDETFTVDIYIEPALPIAGAQFDLSFNASLIQAVSTTQGPLLGTSGCGTFFWPPSINNSAGTITGFAGTVLGAACSTSTSETFATITFTAGSTEGASAIQLSNVKVVDPAGVAVDIEVFNGTVTVTSDTTPPEITCPADIDLGINPSDTSPAAAGSATATDDRDENVDISYSDSSSAAICITTITRTWTATDDSGNSASCDQIITYTADTTAPKITCPADIDLGINPSDTSPAAAGSATAVDACDPSVDISHSDSSSTVDCITTITRTWTATDDGDNSASCNQSITYISDTTPPVITCPADIDLGINPSDTSPAAAGTASATDGCDDNVDITFSDSSSTVDCVTTITRTWTAADDCGNTASCSQIITYTSDTTPPVITCPADIDLGTNPSDTSPAAAGSASATDDCDPNVDISFSDSSSTVGYVTTITRTWTATDDCGNSASCVQIITYTSDTPPPVITCPADVTVECDEPTHPDNTGYATSTGDCGTPTVTWSDVMYLDGCNGSGYIERAWTATDDCGNSATCVQIIYVVDTTPPVISCPADIDLGINPSDTSPAAAGTASATDDCDENVDITYSDSTSTVDCVTTITRTWTATDDCGNSASCSQIITYTSDTTAPVITCPADIDLGVNPSDTSPAATGTASASDDCDPSVDISHSDSSSTVDCVTTITRTWTATDDSGNTASCIQIITYTSDTTPPVITLIGNNPMTLKLNNPYTEPGATASDNCCVTDPVTIGGDAVDTSTPGIYYVTYDVNDCAGNSATQVTRTVYVEDTPEPEIGYRPSHGITFRAKEYGGNPRPKRLVIYNSGPKGCAPLIWNANDDADWLTLDTTSGNLLRREKSIIALSVDTTGMATGTYTALITIEAPGASNSPQQLEVQLVIR